MLSWLVLIAVLGRAPESQPAPLEVTPEMRSWVTERVPGNGTAAWRWKRLAIELTRRPGFTQAPLLTSTASEAFLTRRGNCVSLAHLAVALAREANLEAYFVLVDDTVRSLERGTLRVEQNHLAAAVGRGRSATVLDLGGLQPLGRDARRVSDRTARAVFLSNRGAQSLLAGAPEEATAWLRAAVRQDPSLARAWANLGVAERRAGRFRLAALAYRRALALAPHLEIARSNLAILQRLSSYTPGWAGAWRSAAQRLPDRWTAELEIPFSTVRFQPGSDRIWGLSFLRTVPRRLETALWSAPTEHRFRVSSFGTLTGLELGRSAEKKWRAIPYVLAVVDEDGESDFEVGGDFRWRPAGSMAVDLTANPDFALVEADVEEINLTRFELSIAEKRPFFLEGSEMFRQRIRQFYSRRIGDITWGGKAIGKVGNTDFSALVTSEEVEGGPGLARTRPDYGVVRLQQSLPRGSTLGLLGANRRLEGEDQGSVGLDATLFFTRTLGFTGQLLRVHGPTADGGLAWFLRPAYDSQTTHFHVRYTNLDPGIRDDFNAVGFLRDDDRREWDTNFRREVFFKGGAVENVEASVNYNRYYSQEDVLRSWELDTEVEVVFRNKWEMELEYTDEFKLFEKEFYNDRLQTRVGWDTRDGRSVFGFVGEGMNFDSDLFLYGADVEWPFGDRLRLGYEVTRLELEPDPEGDTTWIHVLEMVYSLNPDNSVKLFAQTNSSIDKVNVQAVWVWRFRPPFGSLQVAYQTGTSERGEASEQGDTLFSKLSWVL